KLSISQAVRPPLQSVYSHFSRTQAALLATRISRKFLGGFTLRKTLFTGSCLLAIASFAFAQDQPAPAPAAAPPAAPAAPAAPTALSTPAITGPLSNLPPAVFDAGFFGKISANGILS